MSVVTTMGYSGILVAPSVIGFVGERTGFAPVFIAIAIILVARLLLSGLTRTADFSPDSQDRLLPSIRHAAVQAACRAACLMRVGQTRPISTRISRMTRMTPTMPDGP